MLTDFGLQDHYVAAMKARILSIHASATMVDVSHLVPPQNVRAGAYLLQCMAPYFPAGSVVCAVVDPGVGSSRPSTVFQSGGVTYLGPNNGLFAFLPDDTEGYELDKPEYWSAEVSPTFHGRDVFAPCAAHVASGLNWRSLGSRRSSPAPHDCSHDPATASGSIIYFDHFGNAVTSYTQGDAASPIAGVGVGDQIIPMGRTFADVAPGAPLAYVNSAGFIGIAVRNGNARTQLALQAGQAVSLIPESEET